MLVDLRDDVRVEEWFLWTLGIARIKMADMAKLGIGSQTLAKVVEFLDELEPDVAIPTLSGELIVIPRVFLPNLFLGQADFRGIRVVRDLNTQRVLRL